MPEEILPFLVMAGGMVFASAVAQSLTGFGFALLLAPLLSLVWDPRHVVVVSAILNGVLSLSLTVHSRRDVSFPMVGLMMAGALAGIPLGLLVLTRLDPSPLRVLIGALVILLGGLVYYGVVRPFRRDRLALLVAGLLSGMLHGSTSMGGPPVVLCLMGQGYPKVTMRGTLLGFFGPLSVLTVAGFWLGGLVDESVLWVAVAMVPPMAVGTWLGDAAFRRAPADLYRAMVALLIACAGVLSLVTGLLGG